MIYVTEPGHTGGVGAIGMRVLVKSLRDAGHDVKRVRLFRAAEDADQQLDLFGRDTERVVDHSWLAKPDAWFVSVLYVRQYVEVREMFQRMGVPMRAADRSPSDPLIAMGGQFSIAPEPLAEFADVIALGDGELTGGRIADLLRAGAGREEIMRDLRGVRGFYVPRFGVERFERWEAETYSAVTIDDDGRNPTVELARGCASKCAFCRIGWAGGSYREAPREQVEREVRRIGNGGRINIFAPDYSSVSWVEDLEKVVESVGCRNAGRDARADATHKLLNKGGGVKSYSFGVEGVSERLRAAVGKPLASDRLVETMAMLGRAGVYSTKHYMLFGLPGETAADHDDYHGVIARIESVYNGTLSVTASQVKGLPHTPLERIANGYSDQGKNGHSRLLGVSRAGWVGLGERKNSRVFKLVVNGYKGRDLHEHDCVLLRSGRDAARYVEEARESDIASGRWRERGLNLDLLNAIDEDAPTAWDHVVAGPSREMRRKALDTYWRTIKRRALPVAVSEEVFK